MLRSGWDGGVWWEGVVVGVGAGADDAVRLATSSPRIVAVAGAGGLPAAKDRPPPPVQTPHESARAWTAFFFWSCICIDNALSHNIYFEPRRCVLPSTPSKFTRSCWAVVSAAPRLPETESIPPSTLVSRCCRTAAIIFSRRAYLQHNYHPQVQTLEKERNSSKCSKTFLCKRGPQNGN